VRFKHGGSSHELAVSNTKRLIDAAVAEGVSRFVHVSIANPEGAPHLPYYHGKAELEDYLRGSGLRHSIVRPTVVYGNGDILINNIAWFLRHFPFFGIPGDGSYRIQPVFIEDYADLIVRVSEADSASLAVDAVGADSYSFAELVGLIKRTTQSRCVVAPVPPRLAWLATAVLGKVVHDVVLTPEEIEGLMAGLLTSADEPTCPTTFGEWLVAHRDDIGRSYASELVRRL
jgi:NADH dehydrogenase